MMLLMLLCLYCQVKKHTSKDIKTDKVEMEIQQGVYYIEDVRKRKINMNVGNVWPMGAHVVWPRSVWFHLKRKVINERKKYNLF